MLSLVHPTDNESMSRQDIDIRTVLIICVSVVAGIIWIAVCCLCVCVIVCQRIKSKNQYVIICPQSCISVPYVLVCLLLLQARDSGIQPSIISHAWTKVWDDFLVTVASNFNFPLNLHKVHEMQQSKNVINVCFFFFFFPFCLMAFNWVLMAVSAEFVTEAFSTTSAEHRELWGLAVNCLVVMAQWYSGQKFSPSSFFTS